MQRKSYKTLLLRNLLGQVIRDLRVNSANLSGNRLANEYDIGNGTLSRIETGVVDVKFVTLWKVAESLNIKLSKLVEILEDKLDDNFKLIEE